MAAIDQAGPVEVTGTVQLGTGVESCGWECEPCDEVSGLSYSSPPEATRALAKHQDIAGCNGAPAPDAAKEA